VIAENRVFEVSAVPYPGATVPVPDPAPELLAVLESAATALDGHTVWHVNSTCDGGGVAELLYGFLRRHNDLGVPTRWLVADATPDFFEITKRLYFKLYGTDRGPEPLTTAERDRYVATTAEHATAALTYLRPGDAAILHDPQTLGMAAGLRAAGVRVIWQCHLGSLDPNPWTDQVWSFFGDDLFAPDGYIFSHPSYVPETIDGDRVRIIPPAIDPASPKNRPLSDPEVLAVLTGIGLTSGDLTSGDDLLSAVTGRTAPGWLAGMAQVDQGAPLPAGASAVLQVSRWDTLKDMAGVLTAFIEVIAPASDAHLVLAGPDPLAIADDPGGVEVLAQMRETIAALPGPLRDRIHLVITTGDDLEGTAFVINALQQRAQVITQKSIKEGFGLTITEGMLKRKPVVAPAVGAIGTQVIHGRTGLLMADALNLREFGLDVLHLLHDAGLRDRLAAEGLAHCTRLFLIDRQLGDYGRMFAELFQPDALQAVHG
jgi:trehalose synthase